MKTYLAFLGAFLSIILLLFIGISCSKFPTGPSGYGDPNQLNWTFDTLAYPGSMQTSMKEIWLLSTSDIYVVGHNDQSRGMMWHFDGKSWTSIKLGISEGGFIIGASDLYSVRSIASNDAWAVGVHLYDNPTKPPNFLDSSLILHFNGSSWSEYVVHGGRALHSMWFRTPDDGWACGNQGSIFHYDGVTWERDSVPLIPPAGWDYDLRDVTGNNSGDVYVLSQFFDTQGGIMKYHILRKRNGIPWAIIDSSIAMPGYIDLHFGNFSLWTSPSGKLYSVNGDIFSYNGSSWDKIYAGANQLRRLFGPNDRDIFAVGDFGNVLHFDGAGWTPVTKLKYQNIIWMSGWADGKEVYVLGNTVDGYATTTVIAHGK